MANGLLNNLVAFYKGDEASATDNLADAHSGAKHLTKVNDPTVVVGKVNGGRGFLIASARRFTLDDAAFKFTGDFTATFWWKPGVTGATQGVIAADNTSANSTRGWGVVQSSSTNRLNFYVGSGSASVVNVDFSTFALSAGTRYFVAVRRSGTVLSISVTPESETSLRAAITGTFAGAANQTDAPFSIGCRHSATSTASNFSTGEVDEVGLWSAALSDAQIGYLFEGADELGPMEYSEFDTGTIAITTPVSYQVFQRDGSNVGDIAITGTYTGSPTAIEARFNGGAWATIDASPAAGSYSGTLSNQAPGQGTLEVRFTNETDTTSSRTLVGVGDIFVCAGQSNMSGRGTSNQSYSHATLKACLFGNDYTWKELSDPYDSATSQTDAVSSDAGVVAGSFIPLLATELMALTGVPVAFIPCAKGATGIDPDHLPGVDHQDRATLYGSMVYRALQVGGVKCVLWFQGETDAINGVSQADYNADLDTIANAIQADLGVKLMACKLHECTDRDVTDINLAIVEAG